MLAVANHNSTSRKTPTVSIVGGIWGYREAAERWRKWFCRYPWRVSWIIEATYEPVNGMVDDSRTVWGWIVLAVDERIIIYDALSESVCWLGDQARVGHGNMENLESRLARHFNVHQLIRIRTCGEGQAIVENSREAPSFNELEKQGYTHVWTNF
jgi:hypothetical protein